MLAQVPNQPSEAAAAAAAAVPATGERLPHAPQAAACLLEGPVGQHRAPCGHFRQRLGSRSISAAGRCQPH